MRPPRGAVKGGGTPRVHANEASRESVSILNMATAGSALDLLNQLERLAGLKATGVLTDDEFAAAKQRLIQDRGSPNLPPPVSLPALLP